jgi:hypothetical protein
MGWQTLHFSVAQQANVRVNREARQADGWGYMVLVLTIRGHEIIYYITRCTQLLFLCKLRQELPGRRCVQQLTGPVRRAICVRITFLESYMPQRSGLL